MVLLAVLFDGVGSAVVLVIVTPLVMDPKAASTLTVNTNVPVTPTARLAVVTVTLLVLVTNPTDPLDTLICARKRVNPAFANESVKVTLAAALGPALPKTIV